MERATTSERCRCRRSLRDRLARDAAIQIQTSLPNQILEELLSRETSVRKYEYRSKSCEVRRVVIRRRSRCPNYQGAPDARGRWRRSPFPSDLRTVRGQDVQGR